MSAVEIAKSLAAKRSAEEAELSKIRIAAFRLEEARKVELQAHIDRTLVEFADLPGFGWRGNTLYKGTLKVATIWVQWHTWKLDESPVINLEGYAIWWKVEGEVAVGRARKPEDFDKRFGAAMARYL